MAWKGVLQPCSSVYCNFYGLLGGWAAFWDVLGHQVKCSTELPLQLVDAVSTKISTCHCCICSLVWFFYCFQHCYILQNFTYGWEGDLASESLKIHVKIKQTPRHCSFCIIPPTPNLSLNSWSTSQNISGLVRSWVTNWACMGKREEGIKSQSQECQKNYFAFCYHIPSKNIKTNDVDVML